MKIYIISAYPYDPETNFAASWLKESAANDPFKLHTVTEYPEEADIILFTEHHPQRDPYFFKVLNHSLYKKYKKKCYLYHDSDYVVPLIPGIYPSIEDQSHNTFFTQPGHYIARLCQNEAITLPENLQKRENKYLFSFIGAVKTHHIRKDILKLQDERSFLKDTSGLHSWLLDPSAKLEFETEYVKVSHESSFVLCPRGVGPNTYRLYETMEMSIAPVIISDQWVPTPGPDWENFSIRIPESEVHKISEILREKESEAIEMGKKARIAWEKWFSKDVSFHHLAESCHHLHQHRNNIPTPLYFKYYSLFLKQFHFRNLLRYYKKKFLN
ncbi:MAG: exostosin domain-containing protein [Candidatus Cyclobacteriaceae bacterium M3_2C_046]